MEISHSQTMLLLILSLFLLPTLRAVPYEDCGLQGSPVEATGVEVLEITKRDARIKISGSTSKTINGGFVSVRIEGYGPGESESDKYNLCQLMACPVAPGAFKLEFVEMLPPNYSESTIDYSVELEVLDDKEDIIMCLNFRFKALRPTVVSA
uniref:MD-2-related lipid-recognition domain-containing protein n=1 Tax=Noccaea caerulescens TaxID=107243 RepID=A0A1J3DXM6_NOCCA